MSGLALRCGRCQPVLHVPISRIRELQTWENDNGRATRDRVVCTTPGVMNPVGVFDTGR